MKFGLQGRAAKKIEKLLLGHLWEMTKLGSQPAILTGASIEKRDGIITIDQRSDRDVSCEQPTPTSQDELRSRNKAS